MSNAQERNKSSGGGVQCSTVVQHRSCEAHRVYAPVIGKDEGGTHPGYELVRKTQSWLPCEPETPYNS